MKVVHVVNSDIRGGAPKAANALNEALNGIGVQSRMLVQRKFSTNENIYSVAENVIKKQITNFRMFIDLMEINLLTKKEKGRFTVGNIGTDISQHKIIKEADVIHLHWINEGFLSIKSIEKLSKLNKPLLWTFHDMWGFTGGCHYSGDCYKYQSVCGTCPYLKYSSETDISNAFHNKKMASFKNINLTIITCSKWLAGIASKSTLFKNGDITPIPNTLKIDTYKPLLQFECRDHFNLPQDKFLILFGTLNTKEERKGFSYLRNSLQYLNKMRPELKQTIEILVFGSSSREELASFPYKIHYTGRIADDKKLAQCYNAADIFIAPSIEDNLPNTVMESISCGVPVVAFNIGGIPEMIQHKYNGYLAKEKCVEDLAEGIAYLHDNEIELKEMKLNARNKVTDNFSPQIIAAKHLAMYEKALQKKL